jgi:hypothetical protein
MTKSDKSEKGIPAEPISAEHISMDLIQLKKQFASISTAQAKKAAAIQQKLPPKPPNEGPALDKWFKDNAAQIKHHALHMREVSLFSEFARICDARIQLLEQDAKRFRAALLMEGD